MKSITAVLVLCCVGLAAKQADKKEPAKKNPVNITCPITGEDIDPAQTATYQNKLVAFCCEDCLADFKKDPKKFAKQIEK